MTEPHGPEVATWTASDGYAIHTATWRPAGPAQGRVVILHGVQSHGGWYPTLGRTLADAGYEVRMPDRRGSGANREARGDTPSASRLHRDLADYLDDLDRRDPGVPTGLAGISWGGKLALVAAARRPDRVSALALIAPGLHPRVGVARGERFRIALAYFFRPRTAFPIPLSDPALFTDSPEGQAYIAADPLGLRAATARLLAASTFIDRTVARLAPAVRVPSLLMLAGRDRIVDNDRTRATFARLASGRKDVIEYPDGHHTLEFDLDPSRYARDLAAWLGRAMPTRSPGT